MVKIGDVVEFKGKDSYFKGTVVSVFTKLDGKSVRCIVQDDRGLLLVKNPSQAKQVPALEQDPIIWGNGWYAIPDLDEKNKECRWMLAPKNFFDEKGYCADGFEFLDLDLSEEEWEEFEENHHWEPNIPEGFIYCGESAIECIKDLTFDEQKDILKKAGFIVDNIPPWKWDR